MTAEDRKIDTKLEPKDMGRSCAFCMGRTFRRSRLQLKDVGSLLALHYPVRCLSCSKRQSVGLDVARRAVPSTVRQVRTPESRTPWDGSPWSRPETRGAGSGSGTGEGVKDGLNRDAASRRGAMKMPDLHGVRLARVAQMPPGDGENLA